METELNFNEFLKQEYSDWVKEAEISLKGKVLSSLEVMTYEGIKLKPLYTQEDLEPLKYLDFSYPGFESFLRSTALTGNKNNSWLNIADIRDVETLTLKNFLSKNNELCPDGVSYNFDSMNENESGITPIQDYEDLKSLFSEIDFNKFYFFFSSSIAPLKVFYFFDSFFNEMGVNPKNLKGGIEYNPINFWLNSGKIHKKTTDVFDEMAELVQKTSERYPNFTAIVIDVSIFHNAGANAVQELAFVLAIGELIIGEMLDRGFNINDISSKIRIRMSAGSHFFGEISKFRATRVLWANLIKAYGGDVNAQKLNLNIVNSRINKSKLDPNVNMLRTTSEVISAIIGGCNSMQTATFDSIYKSTDDFSLRLALNTQNVLREECNLLDVIDAAGGSYLVENLTKIYADEAWKLFISLIEKNTFIENLKSGFIQDMINDTFQARHKNMLIRKDILIGTNKYPNLSEENGINFHKAQDSKGSEPHNNNNAFYSILNESLDKTEFIEIKKLPQARLSEPFEELRLRSENYKIQTGEYPKVLLACFGTLKQYKARADFSGEYFAVGGFVSQINTFDGIDSTVNEISKSSIKVCVICSSDDIYVTLVEDFARKIKAVNPDMILILAGNPGDMQAQYDSAGVDDYIYLRSNVYEKLSLIMNKLGI